MNESARYIKIVEWSDEDQCFIGQCPGIVGPCCHGDNEAEVYAELCQIVDEWLDILNGRGRIPYIQYPIICAKCGVLWPDFFGVPDHEWTHYIQPDMRREVICRTCYDDIKAKIDKATPRKELT